MQKDFTTEKLGQWVSNFANNEGLPFITKSALIPLKELKRFITKIEKQEADSIRIYFIRFQETAPPVPEVIVKGKPAEGCKFQSAGDGFTQASIAIVPAENFARDENYIFSADDIVIHKKITTLMPGVTKQGTGMNPPGPPKKQRSILTP